MRFLDIDLVLKKMVLKKNILIFAKFKQYPMM